MATQLSPSDPIQAAFIAAGITDTDQLAAILTFTVGMQAAITAAGITPAQFVGPAAKIVAQQIATATAQINQNNAQIAALQAANAKLGA